MCFWTICEITFSNSLPVEGNILIERKFRGNLGSLPGFGKATNFASFQDAVRKPNAMINKMS
jgi:hypothetical protein